MSSAQSLLPADYEALGIRCYCNAARQAVLALPPYHQCKCPFAWEFAFPPKLLLSLTLTDPSFCIAGSSGTPVLGSVPFQMRHCLSSN